MYISTKEAVVCSESNFLAVPVWASTSEVCHSYNRARSFFLDVIQFFFCNKRRLPFIHLLSFCKSDGISIPVGPHHLCDGCYLNRGGSFSSTPAGAHISMVVDFSIYSCKAGAIEQIINVSSYNVFINLQ